MRIMILCAAMLAAFAASEKATAQPKERFALNEQPKRIAIEFRDKRWNEVLEWFAEQHGVPIISSPKPSGTFTFVPQAGKTFTLAEITDILNESLSRQSLKLVRQASSFVLAPTDARADSNFVPFVNLDELAKRPRGEVVRVVVTLRSHKASALAPEVKQLLGPGGQVSTLAGRLVIKDSVANVQQILKVLRELDEQDAAVRSPLAVDSQKTAKVEKPFQVVLLRHADAGSVAKVIDELFNGPGRTGSTKRVRAVADPASNSVLIQGTDADVHSIVELLSKTLDVERPGIQTEVGTYVLGPFKHATAIEMAKILKEVYRGGFSATADPRTNSVILRCSESVLRDVKLLTESLDRPGTEKK